MELITLFWLLCIAVSFVFNGKLSFVEYMDIHYHDLFFYECFLDEKSLLFYIRGYRPFLNIIIFIVSMTLGYFSFGLLGVFISFLIFGAGGSLGTKTAKDNAKEQLPIRRKVNDYIKNLENNDE